MIVKYLQPGMVFASEGDDGEFDTTWIVISVEPLPRSKYHVIFAWTQHADRSFIVSDTYVSGKTLFFHHAHQVRLA